MTVVPLIPHPSTPCEFIRTFTVNLHQLRAGALSLVYRLEGDIDRLRIPPRRQPARADELWRHTCVELFLRTPGTPAYSEFNFSPSGEWAAYRFDDYRSGMAAIDLSTPPTILCSRRSQHLEISVQLELPTAPVRPMRAALSAVLEDRQAGSCYWALAHLQSKPDFHDAAGFTATLG